MNFRFNRFKSERKKFWKLLRLATDFYSVSLNLLAYSITFDCVRKDAQTVIKWELYKAGKKKKHNVTFRNMKVSSQRCSLVISGQSG